MEIDYRIASQTLKGVLDSECSAMLEAALEQDLIDVIGSLPGADKGQEEEHLEYLLDLARFYNKRLHVHVDQLNTVAEKETELLAIKTIEYEMEGRVTAVHGISLAAHVKDYRKYVYELCQEASLSFIACPTAWIDCRRSEELNVNHNALTPVEEMLQYNLVVAIGSDNIHDIYKPFSTGNMKTELRFLLEGLHLYDIPDLLDIATVNGKEVMGLYD